MVKGDNGCPSSNQDGGGSSDTKQPNVMTKSDPSTNSLSKQSLSSLNRNCADSSNHVEVFMKNSVLIIKINILNLLNSFRSNSEDSQSITVKRVYFFELPKC